MTVNLTGKNVEIPPAIKSRVEEKFEALGVRYNQVNNIHVVLHIEHIEHVAEATLHFHGHEMHATATADDMYTAIDQVSEKLSGQMLKHKEKMIDSHR